MRTTIALTGRRSFMLMSGTSTSVAQVNTEKNVWFSLALKITQLAMEECGKQGRARLIACCRAAI